MNTTGPCASEGPLLVAVRLWAPVVPAAMAGVLADTTTSASGEPAVTADAAVLSAGAASVVEDSADADPPASEPARVFAGTCRTTGTVTLPAAATGPASVQVIGPAGIDPVQPLGSETISVPGGRV